MLLALAILAVHSFVPSHHARNVQFHATAHVPDLALLARGRGRGAGGRGPPARRIVRDANGNPINQRGGRGGRGRKGRGDRANQQPSPTAKPAVGDLVSVVEKAHYGTDVRTNGTVARVLTRSARHHRGFKVLLTCGTVGRCTDLIESKVATSTRQPKPSTSEAADPSELSSEDYLASIDLMPPPPGQRLRDAER